MKKVINHTIAFTEEGHLIGSMRHIDGDDIPQEKLVRLEPWIIKLVQLFLPHEVKNKLF